MFNKNGIPFFVIMIPFLCIIFTSFFSTSYHLKVSNESYFSDLRSLKKVYLLQKNPNLYELEQILKNKKIEHLLRQEKYKDFVLTLTLSIIVFMILFSALMITIKNDIINKYINKVRSKEKKLQELNKTLYTKVNLGIQEGKKKDKAILQQSKLARMGSMISMIAHQWRQPLSELSGVLMELEIATKFKKVDDQHIFNSIERSNEMIEFMSNTIDDFRNFYKPDKKKENFLISDACTKAQHIVDATLHNLSIDLVFNLKSDKLIFGYPTEYSQVILNIISNAKDILVERKIENPKIEITISSKGLQSIVTIKDNANGINEKNLESIFDPYYSTKDSSKGTGLGLYISKLIIERNMGGELSVENDKDGAVFKIIVIG